MTDVFFYNSGSLLQALNPTETIVDLTGDPMLDNVVDAFIPTVSQGDGVYGVPFGTGHGRRHPLQPLDLRGPGSVGPHDLGRVRGEQRRAARGRDHTRRCVLRHDVDVAAVRARRLLQPVAGRSDLRRAVHRQRGALRRHPRRPARLPAAAGGLRRGVVERRLRFGDVRGRLADAGRRRHRPVPDADVRPRRDRCDQPRGGPEHRLLRPARTRCGHQRHDVVDAAAAYIAATTEHEDVARAFLAFIASVAGTEAQTAAAAPRWAVPDRRCDPARRRAAAQ